MILSTGKRGIVLLEVLTAVAVLSLGIMIVFRPLLNGLSAIGHLDNRMEAAFLMDKEFWEISKQLNETNEIENKSREFVVSGKTKLFNLRIDSMPISEDQSLCLVRMKISWTESNVTKSLTQESFFHTATVGS